MLRVMLGQVAGVVTTGQRVLPRRAKELGYTFKFPEIDGALRDLLA
jgi:NAD dependent epimerase/dehydratase family enzyme